MLKRAASRRIGLRRAGVTPPRLLPPRCVYAVSAAYEAHLYAACAACATKSWPRAIISRRSLHCKFPPLGTGRVSRCRLYLFFLSRRRDCAFHFSRKSLHISGQIDASRRHDDARDMGSMGKLLTKRGRPARRRVMTCHFVIATTQPLLLAMMTIIIRK